MKTRRLLFTVTLALGLTLALLWALGGNSPYVRAATYQVTNTNASGAGSLLQAILDANSSPGHDTITFGSGISGMIVLTDSLPAIISDLTISGLGAEQLAVSGDDSYRVFYIDSGVAVTITGLTVRDGNPPHDSGVSTSGGGIWSAGTLYLESVRLVNNTTSGDFGKGGGLYVHEGSAMLIGTQVLDNETSYCGGGIYVEAGHATLNGSQVFNNKAALGGGVFIERSATLNETQVYSNVSSYDGGGVYVDYGVVTLDETRIFSNTASQDGGGVFVAVDDAVLAMSGGKINDNVADAHGGGIYISEGTAILTETQVVNNIARADTEGGGGGVYVDQPSATLEVLRGEINDNTALYGGGVYIFEGSVTLTFARVLRNTAPDNNGGGVYIDQATARLHAGGSRIDDNMAGYAGGGVCINEGSAIIVGTNMERNTASGSGGGISVWGEGSVQLHDAEVISNTASDVGGGVEIRLGSATLNNTQVLHNTADGGGGVYLRDTAMLSVNRGEISHNTAGYGGGVYSIGHLTLNETYIAQNTASTGSAILQGGGTITPTTALTVTGNVYQAGGLFAGSNHDLWIEGALTLAGGNFYAPSEPNVFELTGAYAHTGGTYHQTKSVNGSSDVSFPKEGGLILNANGQNLGSTQVVDTANGVCAGVTPGDAVQHCYLITPTLSTGLDATITFYYRNGEIPSGQSCTSMEAYRWTGAWDTMLTRDSTYGTEGRMCGGDPYSIRVVDVNAFSPFAIHAPKLADISAEPSAIDFGEWIVEFGPTASQTVTITNVGDFDLHISGVSLSGDDANQFSLVADSGENTLTPGSIRTVKVAFDPTSLGAKVARLTIESDDGDVEPAEVGLSGRGISGYKIFLPLVLRGL